MKYIVEMIKGVIIGIGNILPGISGSLLAVILQVYHKLIDAINQFRKHPIQAMKQIWILVIGMGIGLLLATLFIDTIYQRIPLILSVLFIGFMVAPIGATMKRLKKEYKSKQSWLTFVLVFGIMLILTFINRQASSGTDNIIIYFLVGIIYAGAMIVPGLSGATLLLIFGLYTDVLGFVSGFFKGLFTGGVHTTLTQGVTFLSLLVGAIIGILVFAKLMQRLLRERPVVFHSGLLALLMVSPISVLVKAQGEFPQLFQVSILESLLAIIVGLLSYLLGRYMVKKQTKKV